MGFRYLNLSIQRLRHDTSPSQSENDGQNIFKSAKISKHDAKHI